jgi:K(+)-stimulated pyrophosphate-energized sodium pump
MNNWLSSLIVFGSVAMAIIYVLFLLFWLKKKPSGEGKLADLSKAIHEGSAVYLNRQYKTVAIVASVLFLIIGFVIGWKVAAGFLIGGIASALTGYIGMNVSVRANSKTAIAAKSGMSSALSLAFKAGSITGFIVAAIGLLSVAGTYFVFNKDITVLIGLGLGAGLISIFARLGGGIYAKAADIGTSLVGKIESNISEDNLKNPGVIADQVGDNVSDCAGMAADIFETYVITFTAGILLGSLTAGTTGSTEFPLLLGGISITASILGALFVRLGKGASIISVLYRGLAASIVFSVIGFYFISKLTFGAGYFKIYLASLIGLLITALMTVVTAYYTDKKFKPAQSVAKAAESGHSLNIISGISVGMESVFIPAIIISFAILGSYLLAGAYGVALSSVAMLSLAGIMVSIDALGPIADNAKGICEATGQSESVIKITKSLDAAGNTVKAITKGYAIASAGLAAFALFSGFAAELGRTVFDLGNPRVLIGLILGVAVVYLFGAFILRSVGKSAGLVVNEIRRQFKEIKGLIEGNARPEYEKTIDIVTKAAIKEMIIPSLIPIVGVLIIGFGLGAEALGGFLIGTIISGLLMSLSMTAGGAAWDNAEKYIEEGHLGGKSSRAYEAAVTGDTVGDSYKDTVGPAINSLIKVVSILALLIVNFLR